MKSKNTRDPNSVLDSISMHYCEYPIGWKPKYSKKAYSYLQYGSVYKDAINTLLEKYLKNRPLHDYSLAPILFLLRQYIELQLKGFIMYHEKIHKVEKNHDILWLYKKALVTVKERYGIQEIGAANEDAEKFIRKLGNFDKTGQVFRYPERSDGTEIFCNPEGIDIWLYERITSLDLLADIAKKVIGDLEGFEGYLQIKDEQEIDMRAEQMADDDTFTEDSY